MPVERFRRMRFSRTDTNGNRVGARTFSEVEPSKYLMKFVKVLFESLFLAT